MLGILRTVLSLMATAGSGARLQRIGVAGAAGLAGVIALGLLVAGGIFLLLFGAFTALLDSMSISAAAFVVGGGLLLTVGGGLAIVWLALRKRRPAAPALDPASLLGLDLDGIGEMLGTARKTIKKRPDVVVAIAAGLIFGLLVNRKR
ncbi:MAG: hypothetical protein AB7G15_15250 [Alphaproteobacteria bacterium]